MDETQSNNKSSSDDPSVVLVFSCDKLYENFHTFKIPARAKHTAGFSI